MASTQLRGGLRVAWQVTTDETEAADRLLASEVAAWSRVTQDVVRLGRQCPHCGSSRHGRPVVLDPRGPAVPSLSLSRAPGIVVVALSGDHPVGVDIERVDEASGLASARVVLHPEERAGSADELTKVWVRKESLLKATGDGLRVAPADIRLSRPVDAPRLLEWVGRELPAASMRDLAIDGYSACLTVLAS